MALAMRFLFQNNCHIIKRFDGITIVRQFIPLSLSVGFLEYFFVKQLLIMAQLIRYCKLDEEHHGENTFDVSRPNIMGNPYTHIKDRTTKALVKVVSRDEAIDRYGRYFNVMIKESEEFRNEFERMVDACFKYDSVYFGCYCRLDERCHSDIIIENVRKECNKRMLSKILKKKTEN